MPYKDKTKQAAQQRAKWDLWREMQDGHADHDICRHCGLDIYALSEDRFTIIEPRWYHFIDPKALGIRPLGKNEPVYDLVRRCDTALQHRYVPEGADTPNASLDPRIGAADDLRILLEEKLKRVTVSTVAEP